LKGLLNRDSHENPALWLALLGTAVRKPYTATHAFVIARQRGVDVVRGHCRHAMRGPKIVPRRLERKLPNVGRLVLTTLSIASLAGSCWGAPGEAPAVAWSRAFGGPGFQVGVAARQNEDGSYVVVGNTGPSQEAYVHGPTDPCVARLDSAGAVVWYRTYPGLAWDTVHSAVIKPDGSLLAVGVEYRPGPPVESDVFVLMTSPGGDPLRHELLPGTGGAVASGLARTRDGGYIITGWVPDGYLNLGSSAVLLLKLDATLTEEWRSSFGGLDNDYGSDVNQTADGGYVIAGDSRSWTDGYGQVDLIRTDAAGNKLWERVYGGSGYPSSGAYSGCQTADGGYVITGNVTEAQDAGTKALLLRTDSAGQELWRRVFPEGAVGGCVRETSDGGFIVSGTTRALTTADCDIYLVKTDASGYVVWETILGGEFGDGAASVEETHDGGYVVAGVLSYSEPDEADIYVVKFSAENPPPATV